MNEQAVKWLREQMEERLAKARAAISEGSGEWWVEHSYCDAECPQPCPKAGQCHAKLCWHCVVDGDDIRIYDEGGHDEAQAAHIALNDPRQIIADCEAQLAILGEHATQGKEDWRVSEPLQDCQWTAWPCHTLRLLASAYRHRPGYAGHWEAS